MKLFNVTIADTGEEICVAARTSNHAAEVLLTFWVSRTGSAPGQFSVGRGAPAAYQDDYIVQNVAAGDVAGVLVRQTDGSTLFERAIG